MRTALLALLLAFLLGATEASAQTTPTFGEKAVGSTDCKNGAFAADFDTLAQCTSTSSTTGTMQKAPIFVGAVTSPPYPSTTCDSSKAGMMQYTASAMQYCNGTAWTSFGATPSGTNAQSFVTGWPDVIVCSNGGNKYVLYVDSSNMAGIVLYRLPVASAATDFYLYYSGATGAYGGNVNLGTYDCATNGWSIAQLVSNGHAFNIANGQAGGTAEMQDGTAGAPGLYFSADLNTGFYRPAADTVAIATNGSEKVRINASGQVALNSITPTAGAILDLAAGTGTALSSMIVPKDTTANRPTTGVEGMLRYNTTTKAFEGYQGSTPAWSALGGSSSGSAGQSMFTGWPDAIVCNITNPAAGTVVLRAHVMPYGNGFYYYQFSSSVVDYVVTFSSTGAFNSYSGITTSDCNASIATLIANGKAFNMANGGGGANEMQDGTAGAPGLYFSADPNTGFYRPAADTVAIATNGTERLRVTSTGSVGVGTTAPAAKMDVAGGIKMGNDASSCTSTNAGTMRWTGSYMQFCTGTEWRYILTASETTPPVSVTEFAVGACSGGYLNSCSFSPSVVTYLNDGLTASGTSFGYDKGVRITLNTAPISPVTVKVDHRNNDYLALYYSSNGTSWTQTGSNYLTQKATPYYETIPAGYRYIGISTGSGSQTVYEITISGTF